MLQKPSKAPQSMWSVPGTESPTAYSGSSYSLSVTYAVRVQVPAYVLSPPADELAGVGDGAAAVATGEGVAGVEIAAGAVVPAAEEQAAATIARAATNIGGRRGMAMS